jgi:class 3 adenylate cyclase
MCHLIAISSFAWASNVGDIIRDGRDIYGDEVNVAARLEALAEPGGICVSPVVRDQVRDKQGSRHAERDFPWLAVS